MRIKFVWIGLVIFAFANLTGCASVFTVSKFLSAKSYLEAGEYDKAAIACEEALNSNQGSSPLRINTNGVSVNADYFSYLCLGASYGMLEKYDKSTEYFLKSVEIFPDKAYLSYLGLAELNYHIGLVAKAYEYGLKAKETVGTTRYYEMMQHSAYDKDLYENLVYAANDFYKLRLNYKELEEQIALNNRENAISIAEQILSQKYKVHFGANGSINRNGNIIEITNNGAMFDLNGIVKGDKILSINSKSFTNEIEWLHQANMLINQYGNTVRYKIERNGRIIDLEAKFIYPEVEQARLILEGLKSNKTAINDDQGPWVKILEPKSARGIKIVAMQNANFVILASGKDEIKTVSVNDSACSISEANLLEKSILPGNVNQYSVSLPLSQGKNKFIVKAVDINGKTTQQQIELEGNESLTKELEKIYDHKVAVVIGINKYNPWPGLEYAVNDAESIRDKLKKMGYDKIIELYNRQATRAAILRILGDDLLTMLGPNDSLLVYFAGHGQTEPLADGQEEGYIIPVDGTLDNYRGTAISMSYIHSMIKKYKAKHILFAFDSCYSGLGLKRGGGKKPVDAFIKNMSQKKVRQILTAGGKDEQAAEEKGHGVFSRAFLDALEIQNTGINKNGYTLASDLGQFVRKQVGEKTQFNQTPMFGWLDGEGDYIFDLN
jgi:tetratricopeptide (TPR) repeat protein